MAVRPIGRALAESTFVVEAPQKRVWDLLGTVVFQQLPLEQVDISGFNRFSAVLNWSFGFLRIPLRVDGTLSDTARPTRYGCVMETSRGPLRSRIRVSMVLRAIDDETTEVSCEAAQEDSPSITGWLVGGLQRDFAQKSFESIGARLQWLCS